MTSTSTSKLTQIAPILDEDAEPNYPIFMRGDVENPKAGRILRRVLERPWLSFGIASAGHLVGIIIVIILHFSGYGIFIGPLRGVPLDVAHGNTWSSQTWLAASTDPQNNFLSSKIPLQNTRTFSALPINIIYSSSAGNCLTKSNLAALLSFESSLYNNVNYQSSICQLNASTCIAPTSVLRLFDGTYQSVSSVFQPDLNFSRITQIMQKAYSLDGGSNGAGYNLRAVLDTVVSLDFANVTATASSCQTIFRSGLPLSGYRNNKDQQQQQLDILSSLQVNTFNSVLSQQSSIGDMNIYFSSTSLDNAAEDDQRDFGFYLMIGSILIVLLSVWLFSHSLFLSVVFLYHLLGTYAWTCLIYRIILNFHYFATFQYLGIFVVGSISIIHFFLYTTTWNSTDCTQLQTIEARIVFVLSRVRRTIILTSLVSALSLFVTASSPLVVVRTVVVFDGVLVVIAAVSSFCLFTTAIVLWALKFEQQPALYPCVVRNDDNVAVEVEPQVNEKQSQDGEQQQDGEQEQEQKPTPPMPAPSPRQQQQQHQSKGKLGRFFGFSYSSRFLGAPSIRWIIAGCCIVLVISFLIIAIVKVHVDLQQPQTFRSSTKQASFLSVSRNSFSSTQTSTVYLVFGVTNRNPHCNPSDFTCNGSPSYDETFDLSAFAVQERLLSICNTFSGMTATDSEFYGILRRKYVDTTGTFPVSMNCFIQAQNSYQALPYTIDSMTATLRNHTALFPTSVYSQTATYYRSYEIGLVDFLQRGTTSSSSPNVQLYSNLLDGVADANVHFLGSSLSSAGPYGDTLRYAAITIDLSLNADDIQANSAKTYRSRWDSLVQTLASNSPIPLQSVFHATPTDDLWQWADAQAGIIRSIFQGFGLSFLLAFVAIALIVNNWILALISVCFVALVIIMLFGILGLATINAGVFESIDFGVVIAISMVYIVPIVVGYGATVADGRAIRTRKALETAAPAILLGGLVFLMASVFLFGCQLLGMFKFGIFVFATSGLSIVFSLVFLSLFLIVFGPEGTAGNLHSKYRTRLTSAVSRRAFQARASVVSFTTTIIGTRKPSALENFALKAIRTDIPRASLEAIEPTTASEI